MYEDLKMLISGDVVTPEDTNYEDEISKPWSRSLWSKRVLAFVKVENKSDVVQTALFCRQHKLDMCVKAGGHSLLGQTDDHVVIDLSHMNFVQVDTKNKTAVVGPGTTNGQFLREVIKHGLWTTVAGARSLSLIGVALRCGVGALQKQYGFMMDNVLEYGLVTASGDTLVVNKDENSEFFWGMKFYGPNFGIVTSLKMKLYDMREKITGGILDYDGVRGLEIIQATRDFQVEKNDPRLFIEIFHIVAKSYSKTSLKLVFDVTEAEGDALIEEFCKRTNPDEKNISRMRYDDYLDSAAHELSAPGGNYYHFNTYFASDISDDLLTVALDCCSSPPTEQSLLFFIVHPAGYKTSEIAKGSSAFPYRQAKYTFDVSAAATSETDYGTMVRCLEKIRNKILPFTIHPPEQEHGKREERLRSLKAKYDPRNVFHMVERNINVK